MHGGADDLDGLFLVKKGQARAFIVSETGKEITLYRLLERDMCIFSASCMLRNINFEILVEAEKDTEAFLIPSTVYQSLLQSSIRGIGLYQSTHVFPVFRRYVDHGAGAVHELR